MSGLSDAITSATPSWISTSRAVSDSRDRPRTTPASHNTQPARTNFHHAVAGGVQSRVDAKNADHDISPG